MEHQELSKFWTKRVLESCSPRELLIVIAKYGAAAVAKRMGFEDIQKFAEARQIKGQS